VSDLGALAPIVERKHAEAAAIHCGRAAMFAHAANLEHAPAIERILAGGTVIAEIKRRSPSGGELRPGLDPGGIASAYEAAGAAAVSVLTDGPDFGGSLDDLVAVRAAVEIPVLRKDFVVAAVQVAEARVAGADWVLLIAAVLGDGGALEETLEAARRCGAGALVEVHTDDDLDRALDAGAVCVGINNRDLTTLTTDLRTFARLRARIPSGIVTIAESGVRDRADVVRLVGEGADAVLVGEALMRHPEPGALLGEMVAAAASTAADRQRR
jgi:indole-3-glycerol phosphate synthase